MDRRACQATVHGTLQARILEWVAISFSRGSSHPRNWTQVSCIVGGFFTNWATRDTQYVLNTYLLTERIKYHKKRENIWERKLELVVTALDWWVRSNFSKMTYPVILDIRRNQLCEPPGEASSWHSVGAPGRKGTCGESSTRSSLWQRWSKWGLRLMMRDLGGCITECRLWANCHAKTPHNFKRRNKKCFIP